MQKALFFIFVTLIPVCVKAQFWDQVTKMTALNRAAVDQAGYAVALSDSMALIGVPWKDDIPGTSDNLGLVIAAKSTPTGNWIVTQELTVPGIGAQGRFGTAVDIDGHTAIVGAEGEITGSTPTGGILATGAAYVFQLDSNGIWIQPQQLLASDPSHAAWFGTSVAIDSHVIVVGAHQGGDSSYFDAPGSAYVFEMDSLGTWQLVQQLFASDWESGDDFGYDVDISGEWIAVGAPDESPDSLVLAGSVYLFKRDSSGVWQEQQKISASDKQISDRFGWALSLQDTHLIVSAPFQSLGSFLGDTHGAAYAFNRDSNGVWQEVQKLIAPIPDEYDKLGWDVSLFGDQLIMGADGDREDANGGNPFPNAGSAYRYQRNSAGQWVFLQKLVSQDREMGDFFGWAVATTSDYALVGAHWEDEDANGSNSISNAGSAYFFGTCQPVEDTLSITACDSFSAPGSSVAWTLSGFYVDSATSLVGCDSIITYDLTINYSYKAVTTETVAACDSYLWSANGQMYVNSGTYQELLTNSVGCDSLVELDLTITQSNSSTEFATACDSYLWPATNTLYTSSGSYQATLTNAADCDSVVTLDLTVNESDMSTETALSCTPYTWAATGMTYVQTGNYATTLTNSVGCDSTVTLALTIPVTNTTVTQVGGSLSANQGGASYQWLDCNNGFLPIPGATSQIFAPSSSGSYAAAFNVQGCLDTTVCVQVGTTGVVSADEAFASLFPNPSSGVVRVSFTQVQAWVACEVYDSRGKLVQREQTRGVDAMSIDLAGPDGLYFLQVQNARGQFQQVRVRKQ